MGRIAVLVVTLTVAAHTAAEAEPRRGGGTVPRLDLGGIINDAQPPAGVPSLASEPTRVGVPRPGGMIAGIQLAPGARIGLGMFGSKGRAPSIEQVGPRKPNKRKAGIGFSLSF